MRSFESSGPDVKIRGTPSHIAEKYITLARDALSSGDPVLAENYLQHAEHYNRIILSYREQMTQGGIDPAGNSAARTHTLAGPDGNDGDEFGDEEGDEFGVMPQQGGGMGDAPPQPYQQQPSRNFDHQNNRYENRQPRHDQRGEQRYNNNSNSNNSNSNSNRNDRSDGQRFDRGDRNGSGGDNNRYRDDRRPRGNGNEQQGDGGFRRRERYEQAPNGVERDQANGGGFQPQPPPAAAPERPAPQSTQAPVEQEQPAFLRRPVRRPRREEPDVPAAPTPAATEDQD